MRAIQKIRIMAGLTQAQLADLAGVSQETISRIEGGGVTRTATLDRLAASLGCTAAQLIEEDQGEAGESVG